MKTSDMLLIGGLALGAWFLFKNQSAEAYPNVGGNGEGGAYVSVPESVLPENSFLPKSYSPAMGAPVIEIRNTAAGVDYINDMIINRNTLERTMLTESTGNYADIGGVRYYGNVARIGGSSQFVGAKQPERRGGMTKWDVQIAKNKLMGAVRQAKRIRNLQRGRW